MKTDVLTPQAIFNQPQRFSVPLFQRPYVWSQDNQWEPLWEDVTRAAERMLKAPNGKHQPHFLGAVVLQQVTNGTGSLQQRTIIDGQQRLTTLQVLLDALQAEFVRVEAVKEAKRVERLVINEDDFCERPEDRHKVWPTNRDRDAFFEVMGAPPPVDYDGLRNTSQRLVEAHRFFAEEAQKWLAAAGEVEVAARAHVLDKVVREQLQIVVIDLSADENAQEIFETLNARGSQLTAADLIKNFVFQRAVEEGVDVEAAYQRYWADFETAFWEEKVNSGRVLYPRASLFLNHWLISRTGEEILAREVFERFKNFATHEANKPMSALLGEIHRASLVYRRLNDLAVSPNANEERLSTFAYRIAVVEVDVVKPLILWLYDPEQPRISEPQLEKALQTLESWLIRRALIRGVSGLYTRVFSELLKFLMRGDRTLAGDRVETFFKSQTADSTYWPDDQDLARELEGSMVYKRLHRGRLRMVLESVEDHLRGWTGAAPAKGAERVRRGSLHIEHVMPRKWQTHWTAPSDPSDEAQRDRLIHTLGNLTLLTGKLNTSISNAGWGGPTGKAAALQVHDVLQLNRHLLHRAGSGWDDASIRARTAELIALIQQVWPVPPGHKVNLAAERPKLRRRVELIDLITSGILAPGTQLTPARKGLTDRVATVLPDGRVELDGQVHNSVSAAAMTLTRGIPTSGWHFFLVDPVTKRRLSHLYKEYLAQRSIEDEDDDEDDDDDE
jgi:hypothetical protein